MIFKAGAVICEISRLASENLLQWGEKKVENDIKWWITCNAYICSDKLEYLPLIEHLGAPRYSELVKPTSVVRYDENWSGLRRML